MNVTCHSGHWYGFSIRHVLLFRHPDGSAVREVSINLGRLCIEIGLGFASRDEQL
jgi:hypothetical protein